MIVINYAEIIKKTQFNNVKTDNVRGNNNPL